MVKWFSPAIATGIPQQGIKNTETFTKKLHGKNKKNNRRAPIIPSRHPA